MSFPIVFFTIAIGAIVTGFIFLWAGIIGSFMIDAFVNNESIRLFTYIGLGLGGVFGCFATYWHERKKHGQG